MISRYFEWGGGAGDVINDIYRYGCYAQMQAMRKPDVAVVGCISHNPHIVELFQHWPEGPELRVRYFPYWDNWSAERRKNRLPNPPMKSARRKGTITFHNHPFDHAHLSHLPEEYIVFSVSAGHVNRNIPDEIVAEILLKSGLKAVFLGRDYKRNGWGNHPRDERMWSGSNALCLINQLSLPASVNVVRDPRCKGVVCCHSSLSLVAGWENKPRLLLYSEEVKRFHFRKPDAYSHHAMEHENAFHGTFDQWKPLADQFFNYLSK